MSAAGMRAAALIAAAGSGERLGRGPKAFVEIDGSPLLALCLEAFEGEVSEVIVALPPGESWAVDEVENRFERFEVVGGGSDRQASVRAMVASCTSELVVVHDVARPFLTPNDVRRVIAAAAASGAASAVVSVADTLVDAATGETVDRSSLRAVQTPQAFSRELLQAAHLAAAAEGYTATDDAALVRRLGHQVSLVEGSRLLTKLTEPGDLVWAEALLGTWRASLAAQRRG